MSDPYDLHSWSQRYRQEAFGEARVRDLIRPDQVVGRGAPSGARAARIWSSSRGS